MRNGFPRTTRWLTPLLAAVIALALSGSAYAGAGFTTVNTSFDGTGHCQNGSPNVNCNIYNGKQYVWTNGGPNGNKLTDGYWFFTVLEPSGQQNPNDGTPGNLSDDYDTWQNRVFKVTGGEIAAGGYTGTHSFDMDENDNSEWKIRLLPYANTPNPGGVYNLGQCYLGTNKANLQYPISPKDCKYDSFKVPTDDRVPPECPKPTFALNADKQWTATAKFQDPGGIFAIKVVSIKNAVATFPDFFMGTTNLVTLKASKLVQSQPSQVVVYVEDVAGNKRTCDPALTTVRSGRATQVFRNLPGSDRRVVIRNDRRGVRTVVLSVNGRRYVARGLRPGEKRTVRIGRSLRPGKTNRVTVRALGGRGGSAMVSISN